MPPADMFRGDRYGVVVEPYGQTWPIATTVRQVATEKMQRNAAAACAVMHQ